MRREGGSAVAEFAIVLPLVLVVLLASVELVAVARIQLEVTQAAREGARQAATNVDPATAVEAVRAARRRADLVVLSLHWSTDFVMEPSAEQRRLADEGADLHAGAGRLCTAVDRQGVEQTAALGDPQVPDAAGAGLGGVCSGRLSLP